MHRPKQNLVYCSLQNSEIFTLTYGSIVRQLITDLEDVEEVNKQLDTMYACVRSLDLCFHRPMHNVEQRRCCRGYNIGIRLIDEFLAKSKTTKCVDFRDTADKIARVHHGVCCITGHSGVAKLLSKLSMLQVGFRMFLSASVSVSSWNADNTACNLVGAVAILASCKQRK